MTGFAVQNGRKLRAGYTTGTCAAAAAKAAAIMLLGGVEVSGVSITVKTGAALRLDVDDMERGNGWVKCAVTKDAGDDPDVTNGVRIYAALSRTDSAGEIEIDGGEGVGRVTKPGLKAAPGKAAINPVPLEMIRTEIAAVCGQYHYGGGIKAVISIPGGAEIAQKTMNGRLGIAGGLSILGTTGIVEPMSVKALIDSIKTEIDVNAAEGRTEILMTPGQYGREFAQNELGYDLEGAVKCSNFIGEALDYACYAGISTITLIGHAGKLIKLAGGIMDTHSRTADCRMEILAAHCASAGAAQALIRRIMECVTVDAAIALIKDQDFCRQVWESVGAKIRFHLRERTKGKVFVRYIVFSQEYGVLIDSDTRGRL